MSLGSDAQYMRLALQFARQGVERGQTPFGACVVKEGELVSWAHNAVWQDTDITAHAEIEAIRGACRRLGTVDLSGGVIYSTCEPCPMCFAACHWARISEVVYGARIEDAKAFGFNEILLASELFARLGGSSIVVRGGCLREEALALFRDWARRGGSRAY